MSRAFIRILICAIILTLPALGGFDSGGISAENLSMSNSTAASIIDEIKEASLVDAAPQVPASGPGDAMAIYTSLEPSQADQMKLMPIDLSRNPLSFIYYKGRYQTWEKFSSAFPGTSPGLWIEGNEGWTWYASMPQDHWVRGLLYVPTASPLSMYEVRPGEFAKMFDLEPVQPGYYYLWYYADSPGRHLSLFAANKTNSNAVTIDVYSNPMPSTSDSQGQCEQNPLCHWSDGQCLCTGENPETEPMPGPVPNPTPDSMQGQISDPAP